MGKIESIKGKIWLIANFSRINLRVSIITLIGLTIALSMTSSYLIYLDTNRADYYISLFDNAEPFKDGKLEFAMSIKTDYSDDDPINNSVITLAKEKIDKEISDFYMTEALIHSYDYVRTYELKYLWNQSRSSAVNAFLHGIDIDPSILDDCVNGSTLPNASDEVIVFSYQRNNHTFNIGDSYNISIRGDTDETKYTYYNITLQITGLIIQETQTDNSVIGDIIQRVDYYEKPEHILFTGKDSYFHILETLNDEYQLLVNENQIVWSDVRLIYEPRLSRNNAVNIVSKSLLPFTKIRSWDNFVGTFDLYIVHRYSDWNLFESQIIEYNSTYFITLLVMSLPSLLLAYLLVSFSLGLINENRLKTLVQMKMRGFSKRFILVTLIVETIILAAMASLLGVLLGIPLSLLLISTSGFLTFDHISLASDIVITPQMVMINFLIGFIFTILAHSISILHLSRSSITSIKFKASKTIKRKAMIFRGNLDLYLVVQGILGMLVIGMILALSKTITEDDLLSEFAPLISLISMVSSLSLLIGIIMAFNRLMPLILQKTSKMFLKKDWWLLSTATKNLSVNIKSTGRLTMLLAISISFLMILSSLPISLNNYTNESIVYFQGTDIIINDLPPLNSVDLMSQLRLSFPEMNVTRVSHSRFLDGIYSSNYMGIEEDFSQAVHWREYCDDKPLKDHVKDLYLSQEDFPIIIDSLTATREKVEVNSTYQIEFHITGGETFKLNTTIISIIDLLPGFIVNSDRNGYSRDSWSFIVTKSALLEDLSYSYSLTHGISTSLWCKTSTSSNEDIIEQVLLISKSYGVENEYIDTLVEKQNPNIDDPASNMLWIVTNFNFLFSLTVIIAIVVLFSLTRIISHKSEVALSRALGMEYKQVFLLMFAEPLLLFVCSGIPGAVIGQISLLIIITMIDPSSTAERSVPYVVHYNIEAMLFIFGSILLVTVFSGLLMSILATRSNVSKILKVE